MKRTILASGAGEFVVPALVPGVYEVTADASGFKQIVREATIEAGSTTEVNLVMQVGVSSESVTVEGASPQIQYESHEVNGRVTRLQINGLPVNGRNYLEFIKLE